MWQNFDLLPFRKFYVEEKISITKCFESKEWRPPFILTEIRITVQRGRGRTICHQRRRLFMNTIVKAATIALALGLVAPQAMAASDTANNSPRDVYEQKMNTEMQNQEAIFSDKELSEEASAAWQKVEENWKALSESADENWEDAKETFQQSWDDFQAKWKEMTSDQS
jgi:hypothetical protein